MKVDVNFAILPLMEIKIMELVAMAMSLEGSQN